MKENFKDLMGGHFKGKVRHTLPKTEETRPLLLNTKLDITWPCQNTFPVLILTVFTFLNLFDLLECLVK